jgi:CRISPR type III-A-associated RAMP protein Csm5
LRQDVTNAAREVERKARMAAQRLERRFLRGGKGSPQYDALRFVEIGDSAPLKTDTVVVHHVEVCGSRQYPILLESLIPGVRVRLPWTCNIHPRLARELNLTRVATPVSESEVLRSLHEFASALLEQDERFFQAVGGSSDLAWATGELAHANDKTAPLIRLGRGKGWLSNTVNLLFKGRHSGAYRAAAERTRGRKRSNAEFPATRKVAVWDDGKRLPMGWAKVRVVG